MINQVLLYQPSKKRTLDIIQLCEIVQIKGDIENCARECELTLLYSFHDKSHEKIFPSMGDVVYINEGKQNYFFGMVMDRTLSMDEKAVIKCYDPIIHLTKSAGTYNFKKAKPEDITKSVAKSAGLNIGSIATTGVTINQVCDALEFYEIIMQAYTRASLTTKKKYIPKMNGSKFDVIEKGVLCTNQILSLDANITNFVHNSNIMDMVNRVQMYDDKGKHLGKIDNDSWINSFGIFQQVATKEENKNIRSQAQAMIKGTTSTFSVELTPGIPQCQTGYSVRVQVPYIDVVRNQNMFIDADTHTWNLGAGIYTTELNLSFNNIMDEKELDEGEEEKKTKK